MIVVTFDYDLGQSVSLGTALTLIFGIIMQRKNSISILTNSNLIFKTRYFKKNY